MAILTDRVARNLQPSDNKIADGSVTGLYLHPSPKKGTGSWKLRFTSPETGKRRDVGLGSYPAVGIAEARAAATLMRGQISKKVDPLAENKRASASKKVAEAVTKYTFELAARQVFEDLKPGWKNEKHAAQWLSTLETYVFPKIGMRPVGSLTALNFADVLRPIWLDKVETATRVKQRCHAVMKWCWGRSLVVGNVVDMVDTLLPKQPSKTVRVQHQPAVPWRDIPAFVQDVLRRDSDVTRDIVEFVLLTAARSGEARSMTWDEVDLEARIWSVPAGRMKAKMPHRVPLSAAAMLVLKRRKALAMAGQVLVFPAPRGGVLTDMAMTSLMRKNRVASSEPGRIATIHGFRSSFRDWASEQGYPQNVAERALAHTIKNQAEAAYHRTDLLDQRRAMMEAWALHVSG